MHTILSQIYVTRIFLVLIRHAKLKVVRETKKNEKQKQ